MGIAHIETKKREDFPEFKDLFDLVESFMGYLPNAYLLMADKPDLMQAFAKMSASVFSADVLDIPCLLYTSPSPRDQRGSGIAASW